MGTALDNIEGILKIMVAVIVLSFFGVVVTMTARGD